MTDPTHLASDTRIHVCPTCKCQFMQPFVCTTCGAEKLYDATVRSQAATITQLTERLEKAVDALECVRAFWMRKQSAVLLIDGADIQHIIDACKVPHV